VAAKVGFTYLCFDYSTSFVADGPRPLIASGHQVTKRTNEQHPPCPMIQPQGGCGDVRNTKTSCLRGHWSYRTYDMPVVCPLANVFLTAFNHAHCNQGRSCMTQPCTQSHPSSVPSASWTPLTSAPSDFAFGFGRRIRSGRFSHATCCGRRWRTCSRLSSSFPQRMPMGVPLRLRINLALSSLRLSACFFFLGYCTVYRGYWPFSDLGLTDGDSLVL
jgi:hypothetical protein